MVLANDIFTSLFSEFLVQKELVKIYVKENNIKVLLSKKSEDKTKAEKAVVSQYNKAYAACNALEKALMQQKSPDLGK